jgi:sugar phosphate permease
MSHPVAENLSSAKNSGMKINHALPWVIWVLGATFYAYEYLLRVTPNAMGSELMRAFHLSAESLGGLAAFYYYAYTPMQLPVGVLMDRFGPRRLITVASLVCAIGTFLFLQTGNLSLAQFGRFLVGFGSAFAFVGVMKLSANWFMPNRFAFLAGLASSLGVVGAIFGVVVMTALVENIGWIKTVMFSGYFGIFLALLIFFVIRDRPKSEVAHHFTGVHEDVSFKAVFSNFFKVILNPYMWLVGMIGCLLYLPTTSFADMWGELYLEQALHMTKTEASWANAIIFLGWGMAAPFTGYLSDRIKQRRSPMMWGAIAAAITISIILFVPSIPHWLVFVLLFILGVCYSTECIVFAVARELSPFHASGTAVATTNMMVMLGGVFAQPLVGRLLDWRGESQLVDGVHIYSISSYQFALSLIPIGLIIAAVLVLLLPETFGERYEREIAEIK